MGDGAGDRRRRSRASPARCDGDPGRQVRNASRRRRPSSDADRRPRRAIGRSIQPALGVPSRPSTPSISPLTRHRPGDTRRSARAAPGSARRGGASSHRRSVALLAVPASWPGSPARPGPRLARSRRPPARGGSPRRVRRPARTTRRPADGAPATQLGLLVEQARLEHVGEQVVVAIPPSPVVERDEEQVPSIERLQRRLATVLAGDGIAQRAIHARQDRGLQQEACGPRQVDAAGPLRRGSRRCSGRLRRSRAMKPATSSRPCIESPASWRAAIQPSVRPSSAATSCAVSPAP